MDYIVSEVICVNCGHRWIAAHLRKTLHNSFLKDLKCKNCGKGYIIETGQVIEEAVTKEQ